MSGMEDINWLIFPSLKPMNGATYNMVPALPMMVVILRGVQNETF